MKACYITFRSVTFAQRGQSVLDNSGIRCSLQRTPRFMEEQGCGYCLRLREADCSLSTGLLRSRQIPFRKCYRQAADGSYEETGL